LEDQAAAQKAQMDALAELSRRILHAVEIPGAESDIEPPSQAQPQAQAQALAQAQEQAPSASASASPFAAVAASASVAVDNVEGESKAKAAGVALDGKRDPAIVVTRPDGSVVPAVAIGASATSPIASRSQPEAESQTDAAVAVAVAAASAADKPAAISSASPSRSISTSHSSAEPESHAQPHAQAHAQTQTLGQLVAEVRRIVSSLDDLHARVDAASASASDRDTKGAHTVCQLCSVSDWFLWFVDLSGRDGVLSSSSAAVVSPVAVAVQAGEQEQEPAHSQSQSQSQQEQEQEQKQPEVSSELKSLLAERDALRAKLAGANEAIEWMKDKQAAGRAAPAAAPVHGGEPQPRPQPHPHLQPHAQPQSQSQVQAQARMSIPDELRRLDDQAAAQKAQIDSLTELSRRILAAVEVPAALQWKCVQWT